MIVLETDLPLPKTKGKVRDVYDLGEYLLLVATDRISAFDEVLPVGVPRKGEVLTAMSAYWFEFLNVFSHFETADYDEMLVYDRGGVLASNRSLLEKRSMVVKKYVALPIECVVRGFLAGSAWKEYEKTGEVCGRKLPPGLRENFPLPEPIFTPALKSQSGHDENISFQRMEEVVREFGVDKKTCERMKEDSIGVYRQAAVEAFSKGILIADTKLEWGSRKGHTLALIDEAVTPDSSRFWEVDKYRVGEPIDPLDKQYVRDFLRASGGVLTPGAVETTTEKYLRACRVLTGLPL